MVIIIYAEKNYNHIDLLLENVRVYGEGYPTVVIDNTGDDDFGRECSANTDITYVLMDEGYKPVGATLNEVIRGLEIKENFILIETGIILTDGVISELIKSSEENLRAGVIAACCNSLDGNQSVGHFDDYSSFCNYYLKQKDNNEHDKWSICFRSSAELFDFEAWCAVGGFDEELTDINNCFCDYSLRLLDKKYKSVVSVHSAVWNLSNIMYFRTMKNENHLLEKKWGIHYINGIGNRNLTKYIKRNPEDVFKVLEIGCTCGSTLLDIKDQYPNSQIYGAEINADAVRIAATFADAAIVNNIEDYNLDLGIDDFDYILFGDVLEHLRNPLEALKYAKTLLKAGGKLLISVPNLMHISVMKKLLDGDFTYTDYGLLDRTHIHFFTANELKKMLREAKLVIEAMETVQISISEEDSILIDKLVELSDKSERYMYEAFQYVAVASAEN